MHVVHKKSQLCPSGGGGAVQWPRGGGGKPVQWPRGAGVPYLNLKLLHNFSHQQTTNPANRHPILKQSRPERMHN